MEINPFESNESEYSVLVNDENQHSLWLITVEVPRGWTSAYGPNSRRACVDYIEQHWTDMRPRSLTVAMNDDRKTA